MCSSAAAPCTSSIGGKVFGRWLRACSWLSGTGNPGEVPWDKSSTVIRGKPVKDLLSGITGGGGDKASEAVASAVLTCRHDRQARPTHPLPKVLR